MRASQERAGAFLVASRLDPDYAPLSIFHEVWNKMTLRIAVQMDPLESININGDSSFHLMLARRRAAIRCGTMMSARWRWMKGG